MVVFGTEPDVWNGQPGKVGGHVMVGIHGMNEMSAA